MKSKIIIFSLTVFCGSYLLVGCDKKSSQEPMTEIAVANSYLEAAVKDICNDQRDVFNLVPPGMCPGHFDISPSQVIHLSNCKILFVFDFQKNIEKAIPRMKQQGLKICQIIPSEGLCIPATYISITRQVAAALSELHPDKKSLYELRLKEIENRLDNLSDNISEKIKSSHLAGSDVLTSMHQKEFVKWLGLNPVSTFPGRDTATPAQINQNLQEAQQYKAKFIIANKQEGTDMAQAIAERLKVRLVVFSNFPSGDQQNIACKYDELITENVNNLIKSVE